MRFLAILIFSGIVVVSSSYINVAFGVVPGIDANARVSIASVLTSLERLLALLKTTISSLQDSDGASAEGETVVLPTPQPSPSPSVRSVATPLPTPVLQISPSQTSAPTPSPQPFAAPARFYRFATIPGPESVYPPVVGNFDSSDTALELGVISGSNDRTAERDFSDSDLYVTKRGGVWWSRMINRGQGGHPISAGDLDGLGAGLDIIATSPAERKLFAFRNNGDLIGQGVLTGNRCFSTAFGDVVPDAVRGNQNELLCAGDDFLYPNPDRKPRVKVLKRINGTWQQLWTYGSRLREGAAVTDPALGDMDGDGNKEIAFSAIDDVTRLQSMFLIKGENGQLENGSWPVTTPQSGFQFYFGAKPTIANTDSDSQSEAVVIADNTNLVRSGQEEGIVVFKRDGRQFVFQSDGLGNQDTVVANVDPSTSAAEVLFQEETATGGILHVFRFNGQNLQDIPGWPQPFAVRTGAYLGFAGPLAVGDIDGDVEREIVLITIAQDLRNAIVNAWNPDGTRVNGYPFQIPTGQPSRLPGGGIGTDPYFTVLTDIDQDGKTDIILQSSEKYDLNGNGILDYAEIYLTVIPTEGNPTRIEWGQFGHDNQRTRSYR